MIASYLEIAILLAMATSTAAMVYIINSNSGDNKLTIIGKAVIANLLSGLLFQAQFSECWLV